MKNCIYAFLLILLVVTACDTKQNQRPKSTFAPKIVEAHGYIVPQDSMSQPKVILVDEKKLEKMPVRNPKVVITNTNIHVAITTNIRKAGTPRICTPGQDTFLLPKTIPAIDSPFLAGIPEIVTAKDFFVKDQNPEGFSSLSKLQGLKHDFIGCMLQDKSGNLWFGTIGGGVSKYDGRAFTHFTEKEGLSKNIVLSILEDKNGNLWFGTNGGGVSKYNGKSFTHFTEKQGLSNNTVMSILEDKSGNIWFGTQNGGVSKYDGNRIEEIERMVKVPAGNQQDLKRKNGKFIKSFTHFTENEGLSNNTVFSMLEDKNGNIWFGTQNGGVSKYDGKSFTHFTEKEGLSNNNVWSILEDKNGNLWFGTNGGGVSKYDGGFFTHFTEKEGPSNNIVRSILEDESGNLWFGTQGGGVSKYDGNRVEEIEGGVKVPLKEQRDLKRKNGKLVKSFTHFTEAEGLSSNIVWSILEDKSGNLWFGTNGGGVSKYDGKSFTHFTEKQGLSNNIIWSILEDKRGNLWLGTNGGGVAKYDGKAFTYFTKKEGFSSKIVWSILEDKNGNIWFGTEGGGVCKYDGNRIEAIERGEKVPLSDQTDLKRENGKFVKSFTRFTSNEGFTGVSVMTMLEDKIGNLWFATNSGVIKYDGNRVEAIERGVKIPLSDQQDLKTENGKLVKSFTYFTEKEGLSKNTVLSMLEDKSRNLWFGTYGDGVFKYDGNFFTHFTENQGLSNNTVKSILEDESGNLWFGTYGGGVSKYDGNRVDEIERGVKVPLSDQKDLKKENGKLVKSFTHFTEKEGLLNNTVLSMLEDKSGNLWFGTRFGLSRLSPENKEKLIFFSNNVKTSKEADGKVFFKNYAYEDGFLGIGVNGGQTICEDKNGTIWIGANDRLTAYHPEGEMADTVAPDIHVTRVELFDEIIDWFGLESNQDSILTLGNGVRIGDFEFDGVSKWYGVPENLSLAYYNNFLTFNFIGITQKQSKKVKYQYKLEGIDGNWSTITSRRLAPYANLSPGTYSFKVKAMNSEGYWSNELNYTFTIRPPWWKTWWAYSLYTTFIVVSLYSLYRWRTASLRRDKEILEKTVEVRTHELAEKTIIAEANEKDALKQRELANAQKHIIEKKHKEITDSINYAERIQRSFLATTELLDDNLKDYFVFFQPKDVVSGDFYWAAKLNNGNFALVTADSTGHGVPGAIMSILNISSLEKALEEKNLCEPNEILNHTREKIIERLKKDGSPEGGKDGMDASFISFDFKNKKLTYAAANNPIWVVRENQLLEFSPDKMPVGKHDKDSVSFTQHTIDLQKNDVVYALTDGFPDQFGGPKGKKFMSKQLKELLTSISNLEMQEQKEKLTTTFNNWKGELEQVDDVCLIGVRV